MKKSLFAFLFALLFLLSSCYSYKDIETARDELDEKWLAEYFKLEDEYSSVQSERDNLSSDILKTEDYIHIISDYFENENDVTFDQAYDAFDSLHSILSKYY